MIFMLTFVRHAITEYNAQGLFQGQIDVPLSDLGLKQADLVGSYLESIKFDKIYSSDLIRCKQTADAVVKKNKCSPPDLVFDARLREKSFGIFEGKSTKEFSEWKSSGQAGDGRIPGGETDQQVTERLQSFLDHLCKDISASYSSQEKDSKQGISPETLSFEEEARKSGMDHSKLPSDVKDGHIPSFKELGYPVDFCHHHVFLSSHGMLLRILIKLFKQKYNCKISKGFYLGPKCPNTGLTGFLMEVLDGKLVNVDCKFLFCDHHLDPLKEDNY